MDIRTMSTLELITRLNEAKTQLEKNMYILELTYRIYIPFYDKTFEEMLVANGHKIIEEEKKKENL